MSNARRIKLIVLPILTRHDDTQAYRDRPALAQRRHFTRLATARERRDFDLPPGAVCHVVRLNGYQQARMFEVPAAEVN